MLEAKIKEIINRILHAAKPKTTDSATAKTTGDEAYQKKVSVLKHRIILSSITAGVLVLILLALNIYSGSVSTKDQDKIRVLRVQISDLKSKSADIEAKINDAKKYKQLWDKADAKRKNFSGIKINDITNTFSNLADQYNIVTPNINLSLPEVLKTGIFDRQVLEVNLINCTITFSALNDSIAMSFINSFFDTLPGYVVVNDLSITKTKKDNYSDSELVDISTGKITGSTSGKVSFSWYFLKRKGSNPDDKSKVNDKNK